MSAHEASSLLENRLQAAFGARPCERISGVKWQGVLADESTLTFTDREFVLEQLKSILKSPVISIQRLADIKQEKQSMEKLADYRSYQIYVAPDPELTLTALLRDTDAYIKVVWYDTSAQMPHQWPALMARGLYKMGDEELLAELEAQFGQQLSFHDKLACREAMPRELWPESWINIR